MTQVVTWRWGSMFGPEYVFRLASALARHLHLPYELVCVTDDPTALDGRVRTVPMPTEWAHSPRCRRRMWQFDRARVQEFGPRFLHIDLDTVITGDITTIVDRPEPLVCWRAHYANVVSPAFMLIDTGYLHDMWEAFAADPEGYPAATGLRNASDLAMLNRYLETHPAKKAAYWDERHGFVPYFGKGYEHLTFLGIGIDTPHLPTGTRVVMLGGADKHVLDQGLTPWAREHWTELEAVSA